MTPTKFKQQNKVFGKPSSMTDEQCGSLPVFQGKDSSGFPVIISCWKLSPEELEEVNKTGTVYLTITSTGMPPVYIGTESPWDE